jgi:hypothetical protein
METGSDSERNVDMTTATQTTQQVSVAQKRSALLVPGLVAALVAAVATTARRSP